MSQESDSQSFDIEGNVGSAGNRGTEHNVASQVNRDQIHANNDVNIHNYFGDRPKPTEPLGKPEPTPHFWRLVHPYARLPHFTGREDERRVLRYWLNEDTTHPVFVLRALGGFGKSALTWHWLNADVDRNAWPHVVWWSFYETDAAFENFLAETAGYLLGEENVPDNSREQLRKVSEWLQNNPALLMLDGFERELRAYNSMNAAYQGDKAGEGERDRDCISPLAEEFLRRMASVPGLQSKVLMTTRLLPSVFEVSPGFLLAGCQHVELTRLSAVDAVAFFRGLGIAGTDTEICRACEPYGFHPLSLQLLAGLARKSFKLRDDVQAVQGQDVAERLRRRQHHVLEQAYENLSAVGQRVLSWLACFRSPVEYEALQSIAGLGSEGEFEESLGELEASGLLAGIEGGRFDLHPIVRRYAYDRLGSEESQTTHGQLRDYFAAVPPAEKVQRLEDLQPIIELCHHTVRAGQYDEACELFRDRLHKTLYFQFGAYQLFIELLRALFPDGEAQPPKLKKESDRAWTLVALASSYSLSGQPAKAIPLLEQAVASAEKQDSKRDVAIGLGNLASQQLTIGVLQAAEANLRRIAELFQEIEDEFDEAIAHAELGLLLAYRGAWHESESELATALTVFEGQDNFQAQGMVWAYRSLRALLMARSAAIGLAVPDLQPAATALTAAEKALELADETARTQYPYERDYIQAYWLLGAAHRFNGNHAESDDCLTTALTRCRAINLVEFEAAILLELAHLRAPTNPTAANKLATDALRIANRSGYVLQQADIHLFLAQQVRTSGDLATARDHAQKAKDCAECDGGDYTYKVAYEEAKQLLQQLP